MHKTLSRGCSLGLALVLSGLLAGCASPGPLTSRQTLIGGLKASVSQLESEKEELRREVAELKADNHRISDSLVEERSRNGELVTRLDGARNILRSQGLERGEFSSASSGDTVPELDDSPARRRVAPNNRPAPKPRKTPFAEIPGRSTNDGFGDSAGGFDTPRSSMGEDFSPQARRDTDARWLPVTRGVSEPGSRLR
jgi:outer membrane murein-binding lipoprotein Lpp